MDSDLDFEGLVAPLRHDAVSGAAQLGRVAAEVIRRAAIRLQAGSAEEFRWGMGEVSRRVLEAQPAMAPLVTLVRDVMASLDEADSVEQGRHAAASAADAFRNGAGARAGAVQRFALQILPVGGTVGTISSSSTVLAVLTSEAEPRGIGVLCFESRPLNEGRTMAEALASAGVDVTYAVDAAVHGLAPHLDAVLLGADSIGDRGVVNKIGSASLARTAKTAGVPVYILADETKILPKGFPQILDDDRPSTEVWKAPAGVTVWNRYFEVIPIDLVTAVVTGRGVLGPGQLDEIRSEIDFPAGLRAWAKGFERTPRDI